MKKIFALILMAIAIISCGDKSSPTIKETKITYYEGKQLCDEIIPSTQLQYEIYKYDEKERVVFKQKYIVDPEGAKHFREDGLANEWIITYDEDELISISNTSYYTTWDDKLESSEMKLYKKDNTWYITEKNKYLDVSDLYISNTGIIATLMEMLSDMGEGEFPIKPDGTISVKSEYSNLVGKVVETDNYGNWIKIAVVETNDDDYFVYTREITYYE